MRFILPTSVKSFADYYKLNTVVRPLVEAFDLTYQADDLLLPTAAGTFPWLADLQERIDYAIRNLDFNSEIARREYLMAPVLFEVARRYHIELTSEYPITVNSQLKGSLDYFARGASNLLVVEAKQADMTRGFMQLVAELVALDRVEDDNVSLLYGAVSVGNLWQFGILYREERRLVQDVRVYTLPNQLEALMRVLVGVLVGPGDVQAG